MSKCKASAGPEIGLREGSKAVLGIVSAHAQFIMSPTTQCTCPIHHASHNAEKMPSFLRLWASPLPPSQLQSPGDRTAIMLQVVMPSVPESLWRTGWRPTGPLEDRCRENSVPISYTPVRDSLSSDLAPCHSTSLVFFEQCVYVYHKGHRQAELFVI